jgi:hypothetical protein
MLADQLSQLIQSRCASGIRSGAARLLVTKIGTCCWPGSTTPLWGLGSPRSRALRVVGGRDTRRIAVTEERRTELLSPECESEQLATARQAGVSAGGSSALHDPLVRWSWSSRDPEGGRRLPLNQEHPSRGCGIRWWSRAHEPVSQQSARSVDGDVVVSSIVIVRSSIS